MMDFLKEIQAPHLKIVYHANCLDGLFAGWAAAQYADRWAMATSKPNRTFSTYAERYGEPPPLAPNTHLLCVDFAYPPEALAVLPEGCYVTILDHHETSLQAWNAAVGGSSLRRALIERGNVVAFFDLTRSGAGLAWEAFIETNKSLRESHQGVIRKLVEAVEDRDLWKFERADTREIGRALKEITASSTPSSLGEDLSDFSLNAIVRLGTNLLRADKKEIDHLRKTRGAMLRANNPIHEAPVAVINYMGPLLSDLLHDAASYSPSGIAAAYVIEKDKVSWSLRSTKSGPNVAEICARFGGGGHEHAAGFRCSLADFENAFFGLIAGG